MVDPNEAALGWSDVILAACTLLGPILAVQAQKWVEQFREKRARRLAIYRTLMATRSAMLSSAHVEALNAVPIDFYGDKQVTDAWEEYYGHLDKADEGNPIWQAKRIDLFLKLLSAIGSRIGYKFNAAELGRIYFPGAHLQIENDQTVIRRGIAALLKGEITLPMAVKEFPGSPEAAAAQAAVLTKMSNAYADDGSLKVTITGDTVMMPEEKGSAPSTPLEPVAGLLGSSAPSTPFDPVAGLGISTPSPPSGLFPGTWRR